LQQGREVFVQFCAACHGEHGDGKPASGLKLKPPAMDLTAFKLSDSLIHRALEQGVLGTGMAAWKSLPPDQLSAVAVYTATLGRDDELSPQARLAPDRALQEAGRRVYVVHCARCHGEDGKGDGSDASLLKPVPPSFAELRPSYAAAARVLAGGVPGSAMPAWPLLTRAEVQAVTFYVRSFYRGMDRVPAQPPRAASHVGRARP
jgi:mono/diheme cytochrome c family protein